MLRKIEIQPGINRESTQYSAGYSWFDCDKMRFRKGRPEQIGGWTKYVETAYLGVCRSLLDWTTAASTKYLGIGTNLKFYVEQGGALSDITPVRLTTATGDARFAAANGDATLTVAETAHGAVLGDWVTFTSAVSLGGAIVAAALNQEYEIASIIDSDSYTIEAKDTAGAEVLANASDTSDGGAATVAAYQINTGTNNYIASTGYGAGIWGSGTWGGAGSLGFSSQLRLYSQAVFGDDLVFNPRSGGVYFWDESDGIATRAVDLAALPGATDTPTVAYQVMVSPTDKHVICFGVNPIGSATLNPLLVRWSDQENAADWTPTVTNSSGGTLLSSGSAIIGAVRTRHEIIVFTDTSVHAMRFSGAPFIYQFSPIAENVSILSPNTAIAVGDSVYFMDADGFYIYNGAVTRLPCSVLEYVFSGIDKSNLFKAYATNNSDDSEVTWHYPTEGTDVSNYVTFNYAENVWTIGTLDRAAWIQATSKAFPIAATADIVTPKVNYLYNHEAGYDADGAEIGGYIESGQVEISGAEVGDGESLMFLDRFIPDFKVTGTANNADFDVIIKGVQYPQQLFSDPDAVSYASTVLANTKQSDIRLRAREIVLRIESNGIGYGWNVGDFRIDMRTDGKR